MNQHRYEKEIEEILKKAGEKPSHEPSQSQDKPPRRRIALPRIAISYKIVLLAGIIAVAVAAVANVGGLYLFLAGVALLAGGYAMYYRAPRAAAGGSPSPRMWRGRYIDPDD